MYSILRTIFEARVGNNCLVEKRITEETLGVSLRWCYEYEIELLQD